MSDEAGKQVMAAAVAEQNAKPAPASHVEQWLGELEARIATLESAAPDTLHRIAAVSDRLNEALMTLAPVAAAAPALGPAFAEAAAVNRTVRELLDVLDRGYGGKIALPDRPSYQASVAVSAALNRPS